MLKPFSARARKQIKSCHIISRYPELTQIMNDIKLGESLDKKVAIFEHQSVSFNCSE